MPLEIMIDTKRKKGVMKLSTLKRMEELEETITEIPGLSKPISIVNLVLVDAMSCSDGPVFVEQSGAALVQESGCPPLPKRNL